MSLVILLVMILAGYLIIDEIDEIKERLNKIEKKLEE